MVGAPRQPGLQVCTLQVKFGLQGFRVGLVAGGLGLRGSGVWLSCAVPTPSCNSRVPCVRHLLLTSAETAEASGLSLRLQAGWGSEVARSVYQVSGFGFDWQASGLRGSEVWSVRAQECPALPFPVVLDGLGPSPFPGTPGPSLAFRFSAPVCFLESSRAPAGRGFRVEDLRGLGVWRALTFMGFGGPTCLHGSVNVNVGGRGGGPV